MNDGGAFVAVTDLARLLQQRKDGWRLAVGLLEFIAESDAPVQDLAAVLDMPEAKVEAIHRLVEERVAKQLAAPAEPDDLEPRLFPRLESVA